MPRPAAAEGPRAAARRLVATLRRLGSRSGREGMRRYGIPSPHAFGVPVGTIQRLAKEQGRDHDLAAALWKTGWYEARILATLLDLPERVTPAQMEAWAEDFDSWALCDSACFHLFDRTPHAFAKVRAWTRRRDEFVKRAAFALLASLALHDQTTPDAPFARCLPLIERAAADPRNFVKKGVSWALRGIGRRGPALHAAALVLARRLAASAEPTERWVGKDALRDLERQGVRQRRAGRARAGE